MIRRKSTPRYFGARPRTRSSAFLLRPRERRHRRRQARCDDRIAAESFRRIVAPTEFSDCAQEGWGITQRTAQLLSFEVVRVHVFGESLRLAPPRGSREGTEAKR